jgi:hypothetical protein
MRSPRTRPPRRRWPGQRFFVRIGEDIPIHGVLRFNELAAARAAELAGVSPALIYSEPGVMVTRFHLRGGRSEGGGAPR